MNVNALPALAQSLWTLGQVVTRPEITEAMLTEIATELARARHLVAAARGAANVCGAHPGGPIDPTAPNGCLMCAGVMTSSPARPVPADLDLREVLRFVQQHGTDPAVQRYGGRAVALAHTLATRRHTRPPGST